MRTRTLIALAAAASILAACGGASGGSLPKASPNTPVSPQSAQAVFVVKIPPKLHTNSARHPKYLTADIAGIDFSVSQTHQPNAGYAFYPISTSASYCTTPASGGLTCTLPVVALPGADTFVVTTYDQANTMIANVISTGSITANITAQASNTINIVTSGIPTFFTMSLADPYPGVAGSQNVNLRATDADGNVIVGPYDVPITLSDSDTSGATTLSAASAAGSTDASALTLSYTGAAVNAQITVQSNSPYAGTWNGSQPGYLQVNPKGSGVKSSPANLVFSNASAPPQNITLSGGAGTYSADTNFDVFGNWGTLITMTEAWQSATGCQGIATVAATSNPAVFSVSPIHAGICHLNIGDSTGLHGTVPIIVQSL